MAILYTQIEEFMAHRKVVFDFGKRVNIITGANGSGKSTILAALIWTIWGTSERLAAGEQASVSLKFDDHTLTRTFTKQLQQTVLDGKTSVGKTRAEEDLAPIFGTYAAWSRALYITGKKVSAFTSATARAKLLHLENITGVNRINKGYEIANEASKAADRDSYDAESALKTREEELERAHTQYRNSIQACESTLKLGEGLEYTQQRLSETNEQLVQVEEAVNRGSPIVTRLSEEVKEAKATYDALYRDFVHQQQTADKCPMCGVGRLFDPQVGQEALCIVGDELRSLEKQLSFEHNRYSNMQGQRQSLLAHRKVLEENLVRIANINDVYESQQQKAYSNLIEIYRCTAKLVQAKQAAVGAALKVRVAEAVAQALHPTAVRKRYLSSFVQTIEKAANRYLFAMGVKYTTRLHLSESSVVIEVVGLAKPDYDSASSGEQRRIDIAIMLGMAEVGAAVGTVPANAPFVIDEAFDTLDTSGVQALVDLAVEISKTRQVFLVSHGAPSLPAHPDINHIQL